MTVYVTMAIFVRTKFDENTFIGVRKLAEKQNSRWRPPGSWIFNEC